MSPSTAGTSREVHHCEGTSPPRIPIAHASRPSDRCAVEFVSRSFARNAPRPFQKQSFRLTIAQCRLPSVLDFREQETVANR